MSKIIELTPKGSAWLVYHRRWANGGCTTHWAFVFNYHVGLTAYEAWELAKLPGLPPFCEVLTEQLTPFPDGVKVSTKPSLQRMRQLVADNQLMQQLKGQAVHIQPAERQLEEKEHA